MLNRRVIILSLIFIILLNLCNNISIIDRLKVFEKRVKDKLEPVLVMVSRDECNACRAMIERLREVENHFGHFLSIYIVKDTVADNIIRGIRISKYPTLLMYRDDKSGNRKPEGYSKDRYEEKDRYKGKGVEKYDYRKMGLISWINDYNKNMIIVKNMSEFYSELKKTTLNSKKRVKLGLLVLSKEITKCSYKIKIIGDKLNYRLKGKFNSNLKGSNMQFIVVGGILGKDCDMIDTLFGNEFETEDKNIMRKETLKQHKNLFVLFHYEMVNKKVVIHNYELIEGVSIEDLSTILSKSVNYIDRLPSEVLLRI